MSKIEEFLASIGVQKDTIEALGKEPEEGQEIDVASFVEDYKSNQREVLKNDPDFINPITQGITGKERATIEQKIKKVLKNYLDETELDALKGYDSFIGKLSEVIESNKNHNADSEKLQNDLIEANKTLQELREVEIPKIQAEAEAKHKQFIITSKLKEKIGGHELIVPGTVAEALISNEWNNKYNLELSEEGSLTIKTKDGNDVLNENKTSKLTIDDIMKSTFEANKILKQSNGTPEPTPAPQAVNNGQSVKGMPHIDKV